MGKKTYPEEVHEVHRTINELAMEIQRSSISNEDEFTRWKDSVTAVIVRLLRITSRCRVVG